MREGYGTRSVCLCLSVCVSVEISLLSVYGAVNQAEYSCCNERQNFLQFENASLPRYSHFCDKLGCDRGHIDGNQALTTLVKICRHADMELG